MEKGHMTQRQVLRRMAYWICFLLVVLPMLHQAANRWFDWHVAFSLNDFFTGLDIYNALLLQAGGLAPDYVRHGIPVWLWRLVLTAGTILIVRRIALAVAAWSLEPPATFRGLSTLVAGLALGIWCFHVLATFGVPGFYHLSLILTYRLGAEIDLLIAVLLMLWFWPTELSSIPWLARTPKRTQ
jgi:hypothetical protein